MKIFFCPLSALAAFLLFANSAFGQTAELTGTITDASGAVVPGAHVTATNIATGVARATVTNGSGNYLITALLPGQYRVVTAASGFKQVEQQPVTFAVDQVARLDFSLDVGVAKESVSVAATAVLLDSATSSIASVIENKQIAELPLNGRDPVDLLALSPGIRIQSGFGGVLTYNGTTQGSNWSGFSFNGGLAGANPMLVEGLALDSAVMNLPSYVPPADATQEYRAQTNTFTAEYGRSTGAVINFSIKSGTNQLHGSAYEYWRNRDLDANNFFLNRAGTPRAGFNQHQFGGSLGGPIKKDKTFFFGNFEEYSVRQGAPNVITVPTALQRVGNFSQTYNASGALIAIADPLQTTQLSNGTYTRPLFPGNVIPASRLSNVAANLAQIFPLPNTAGSPFTGTNNYVGVSATRDNQHNVVGKFDHNLNSTWKVFGTYARIWDSPVTANVFPSPINFTRALDNDRHHATLSATAVLSPALVAEFHSGFARIVSNGTPNALGYDITKLGFPSSLAGSTEIQSFPTFNIGGITQLGGANASGLNVGAFNSWGERGSLTWVRGSHTFKFGADFRVQQMNQLFENSFEPAFNFTDQMSAIDPQNLNGASGIPLASFLLGYVSSASAAKSPAFANQRRYLSVFAQDDWKVTRKLTLNIGTDYSLEFPITDRYNRKMWFDPTLPVPASSEVGFPIQGGFQFANSKTRSPYDLYLRQWGPRFGLAYQLFPHTVIRSGFGLFWIPATLSEVVGGSRAPGWELSTQMVASVDGGITPFNTLDNPFPQGIQDPPGSTQGANSLLGQTAAANRRYYHTGYMQEWNFDVQQQLASETVLEIAYAGSASVGLPAGFAAQSNQVPDQYLSLGSRLSQLVPNPYYGLVASGPLSQSQVQYAQLLRPFPQFDTLFDEGDPVGHSSYHSFQAQIKHRLGSSLLVTAAYTFSKAISNTEARLDTGSNATGAGFIDNYNRSLSRALVAYDAPQRLVLSFNYELPFGKGKRFLTNLGVMNRLVAGWQANGIFTAQSGTPLQLSTATNLTGNLNAVTDVYGTFVVNATPDNNGHSAGLSGSPQSRLGEWFNTSLFSQPAPYTYGTTGRSLPDVRTQGINNLDFSLFKNNTFGPEGRFNLQFRAEAFNLANRVQFGAPGNTFGNATFGVISTQANNPREIQLALRLNF